MNRIRQGERGAITGHLVSIIVLVLLVLGFGGFSVWSYLQYLDQRDNVDEKVDIAVAEAVKKNSEKMQSDFEKREKEPNRQFAGPADYGSLSFDYPKTWSVYQATDVSSGGTATYQAYLHPGVIPPVTVSSSKYAMRVTIEQKAYDKVVSSYDGLIKKGDLKSTVYKNDAHSGVKLVGNLDKNTYATLVIMKIRDRTVTLRTDGDVFTADFDKAIETLRFKE